MKIFMHWDMEGACGLFKKEQAWYWEESVPEAVGQEGRDLLMADVNSATRAALEAGADEIVVSDTHHGGGNLDIPRMLSDPRVTYNIRSRGYQGAEYRWMPGLDGTVDAFLVPAHHAMAGTEGAFLPHTETTLYREVQINGQSVGEIGLEACFAAHWDIPVIMMHGDEAACDEARMLYPWIVAVPVKKAVDRDHCTGPELDVAHRLVADGIARALDNLRSGTCQPFAPTLPMTITIRMRDAADAEARAAKPTVERVDEVTIQGYAEQYCDVMKWLSGSGLNMPGPI